MAPRLACVSNQAGHQRKAMIMSKKTKNEIKERLHCIIRRRAEAAEEAFETYEYELTRAMEDLERALSCLRQGSVVLPTNFEALNAAHHKAKDAFWSDREDLELRAVVDLVHNLKG